MRPIATRKEGNPPLPQVSSGVIDSAQIAGRDPSENDAPTRTLSSGHDKKALRPRGDASTPQPISTGPRSNNRRLENTRVKYTRPAKHGSERFSFPNASVTKTGSYNYGRD